MNPPTLSVIIPTYNRRERLERCLNALKAQTLNAADFEVLVVNDGSTDDTESFLQEFQSSWPQLKWHTKANEGQGIARNAAVKLAQGEIVVLIDDDIYVSKDFLECHLNFHREHPEDSMAALGLTEWWPGQAITPLMEWMTSKRGVQFSYPRLTPGQEASFWFFYTSNLSIKKSLLLKEAFDTDFRGYGWEDTELGYRLFKKHALKLIYLPQALAFHDNPMDEAFLKQRTLKVAKSAALFESKHPEIKIIPRGLKRLVLSCIASGFSIQLLQWCAKWNSKQFQPWVWYLLSKRYFLQGIKSV